MNAIPYDRPEEEWESYDEESAALPGRPRRQLFTRATALLFAAIVGAASFYAGVRVEKGQLSSSSSTSGRSLLTGATGTAGPGAASGARAGARAGATGTGAASGAASGGLAGGFSRFGGGALGGGRASFGTVSSISGKTLYLTDTSGNTIKVTLSSATKVTKSVGVSAKSVHPGDTVVVSGITGSGGTVQAATVTDSGARASSSGASGAGGSGPGGSGASSSRSGGASSAVGSLFGSGG